MHYRIDWFSLGEYRILNIRDNIVAITESREDAEFIVEALEKHSVELEPKPFDLNGDTIYYCPSCDYEIEEKQGFCHHCGQKLIWARAKDTEDRNDARVIKFRLKGVK